MGGEVTMALAPAKTFQKAAVERRRIYVDYGCWLPENEYLIDLQVVITPFLTTSPLLINTGYADNTNRKLVVYAAGGAANTLYTVQLIVRTSDGQTKRDVIAIKVTP